MARVHPTAIVDPKAELADNCDVGPYCIIGPNVVLHDGVSLSAHVVVDGHTVLHAGTQVYAFAVLGLPPQHTRYAGEASTLTVGENTIIREHVTLHPGTSQGRMATEIGANCFFMVGCHVAHDCVIEDHVTVINGVQIGGHVHVGTYATIGGLSAIHQFARIGKQAMVGGMSAVEGDVIPYGSVKGNRARLYGLNVVGLKRRGYSREQIRELRTAYGLLFTGEGTQAERLDEVAELYADNTAVLEIVDFMRTDASRPLCRPPNGNGG